MTTLTVLAIVAILVFYELKRRWIVLQKRKIIEQEQQRAELERRKRFAQQKTERQQQTNPAMWGKVFEFETVTVNAKGEIVEKKHHQAYAKTEELGNGVTLEMVYVPGGTFMMGSSDSGGDKSETPLHQVTVPPFYMSKYPITQAQCQAVLGVNPSYTKGENRPVERVSWYDICVFCQELSRITGEEYRLPSEAEWEYACRAGTTTPFYFGETITSDLANYQGNRIYASEPKGVYRKQTTDVGQFPPNAFGLYDMHGNIWEWCADYYHEDYTYAPSDGSAWITKGKYKVRLLRGGSWFYPANYNRSAYRFGCSPGYSDLLMGFRVARTIIH